MCGINTTILQCGGSPVTGVEEQTRGEWETVHIVPSVWSVGLLPTIIVRHLIKLCTVIGSGTEYKYKTF